MGFKIFKEIMGEELFEQKMEEADEVNVEHRFVRFNLQLCILSRTNSQSSKDEKKNTM